MWKQCSALAESEPSLNPSFEEFYGALPSQGQGLSHLIQLLEVLPYWDQFHVR